MKYLRSDRITKAVIEHNISCEKLLQNKIKLLVKKNENHSKTATTTETIKHAVVAAR